MKVLTIAFSLTSLAGMSGLALADSRRHDEGWELSHIDRHRF